MNMTSLTQPPVIRHNENHFRSHKIINVYDNSDTIEYILERFSALNSQCDQRYFSNDTAITIIEIK